MAVPACPVLVPELAGLPENLSAVLARLERPRVVGHVELTLSESADRVFPVMHVHGTTVIDGCDRDSLQRLAVTEEAYLSVGTTDGSSVEVHRPRDEATGYRLPEFELRIAYRPGDFLQANLEVNRQLVARVVEWLAPHGGRLLEGFAGIGNLSLALARRGFEVVGLEAVPDMVERAQHNAAAHRLPAVFEVRDLTRPLPESIGQYATVVLNPPRAGARAFVASLAAQHRVRIPERILYLSCAPPTLARDAAVLAGAGYGLSRLCLVDMLPQTRHIETLALFERR